MWRWGGCVWGSESEQRGEKGRLEGDSFTESAFQAVCSHDCNTFAGARLQAIRHGKTEEQIDANAWLSSITAHHRRCGTIPVTAHCSGDENRHT